MRFFVFKQKTAFEMRISDWSSDVCSSDLANCANGDVGGLSGIDRVLKQWVPIITASPAFKRDGLLIITYDESNGPTGDATACCGKKASVSQLLLQPGILGPGEIGRAHV